MVPTPPPYRRAGADGDLDATGRRLKRPPRRITPLSTARAPPRRLGPAAAVLAPGGLRFGDYPRQSRSSLQMRRENGAFCRRCVSDQARVAPQRRSGAPSRQGEEEPAAHWDDVLSCCSRRGGPARPEPFSRSRLEAHEGEAWSSSLPRRSRRSRKAGAGSGCRGAVLRVRGWPGGLGASGGARSSACRRRGRPLRSPPSGAPRPCGSRLSPLFARGAVPVLDEHADQAHSWYLPPTGPLRSPSSAPPTRGAAEGPSRGRGCGAVLKPRRLRTSVRPAAPCPGVCSRRCPVQVSVRERA